MSVDWKGYCTELKSKSLEEIFNEELCPAYDWDDRDAMYYCIVELARRFDINLQKWTDEEDERMTGKRCSFFWDMYLCDECKQCEYKDRCTRTNIKKHTGKCWKDKTKEKGDE